MIAGPFESPEFLGLYAAYTASPESIAAQFVQAVGRHDVGRPLIVATHADIALYPGLGRAPVVEGFRHSASGFKELAAVSHLGPALATLARLKEHHPESDWRTGAEQLLSAVRGARGRTPPSCGGTGSGWRHSQAGRPPSHGWWTTAAA